MGKRSCIFSWMVCQRNNVTVLRWHGPFSPTSSFVNKGAYIETPHRFKIKSRQYGGTMGTADIKAFVSFLYHFLRSARKHNHILRESQHFSCEKLVGDTTFLGGHFLLFFSASARQITQKFAKVIGKVFSLLTCVIIFCQYSLVIFHNRKG